MQRESRMLEYKRQMTDLRKIAQTVVAFANGDGGTIIIGVDDKTRSVRGLLASEIDQCLERLPISLADQIHPPLFPQVFERTIDNREVIVVQVFPGGQKPYCIAAEGIEKGVYIRVGAHTRRAEGSMLEELRLLRSRLSFDQAPVAGCSIDDLELTLLPASLRSEKALLSLDIVRHDPLNGALLPTCGGVLMLHPHPERFVHEAYIVVSRMRGDTGRDTIETIECTGPLIRQCEAAVDAVNRWLGRNPRVTGARYLATEHSLPVTAVREVINNAVFHRQYSIAGPVKIAVYADRLEVFSPGHFAGPFVERELGDGTSYIRNRVIALVARKLDLIEKRGTGIRLMIDSMRDTGLPRPVFEEGANWFKVTLSFLKKDIQSGGADAEDAAILALFEVKQSIASDDVCKTLGVSKATAVARIKRLMEKGRVVKVGNGPVTRYKVPGH